jgi:hypothetical protein
MLMRNPYYTREVGEMADLLVEYAQELETEDGYQEELRTAVDCLRRWLNSRGTGEEE